MKVVKINGDKVLKIVLLLLLIFFISSYLYMCMKPIIQGNFRSYISEVHLLGSSNTEEIENYRKRYETYGFKIKDSNGQYFIKIYNAKMNNAKSYDYSEEMVECTIKQFDSISEDNTYWLKINEFISGKSSKLESIYTEDPNR